MQSTTAGEEAVVQPEEDRFAAKRGITQRPRDDRYTRVAIILHWSIAALIIYNLASGFIVWDLAHDFFRAPANGAYYLFGLTSHLSSGLTVLVLTVARIIWRLMHEPPPYSEDMKRWEKHLAHFAHFLLYAAMVLMPLSGWAILSAHPPAGSAGAATVPPPPGVPPSSGPRPGPPRIWWVMMPIPAITPIEKLGAEPGGVEPQRILHDEFAEWHEIGGWIALLLLMLHVAGALKHQWLDRHPELQRMGIGRRK